MNGIVVKECLTESHRPYSLFNIDIEEIGDLYGDQEETTYSNPESLDPPEGTIYISIMSVKCFLS